MRNRSPAAWLQLAGGKSAMTTLERVRSEVCLLTFRHDLSPRTPRLESPRRHRVTFIHQLHRLVRHLDGRVGG